MVQEESTRGVVNLSKDVANFLPPPFFLTDTTTQNSWKKKKKQMKTATNEEVLNTKQIKKVEAGATGL